MAVTRHDAPALSALPRTDGDPHGAGGTLPGPAVTSAPSDVPTLPLASMRHGDHACAAFASHAEREELLIDFVRGGLESGDRVRCFTQREDASRLVQLLHDALDVDEPLVRGQLEVLDAPAALPGDAAFDLHRTLDALDAAVESALAAGYDGIRFAGETSPALRGLRPYEELEEWEQTLTDFYSEHPAAGFCQYERASFEQRQLDRLIELHPCVPRRPIVSDGGLLRITESSYDAAALRLAGEVDLSNRELLAEALGRAAAAGGDIQLDARRLEFIDLSGFGELVRTALELQPERRLVIHHSPPCLRRLLQCVPGYGDLIHV